MVGRQVRTLWGETGRVIRWEPLGHAMTDALVRRDDGTECWYSSRDLHPTDGNGPLPSRDDARRQAETTAIVSLRACREQLIAEWHTPWPGCEHGKAIIGMAIDGAIASLKRR